MIGICALLLVTATLGSAVRRDISCKDDPDLVGPCFTFHGMLFVANGTPSARILRLGTKRILGISERHSASMPGELESLLENRLTGDDVVYGDFTVCPYSQSEPGRMQFVCVESGSRLILERYVQGKRTLLTIPDVHGR